jgi:hypothetical protein
MKNIKFLTLFFICGILVSQCVPKPIDIALPKAKHKLVIASQTIPYAGIVVSVSISFSSLAGSDSLANNASTAQKFLVTHANVTITVNGGQVVQLHNTYPGIYASTDISLNPGTTYTLHVKDSITGLECSAASVMPQKVAFDSIKPIIYTLPEDTAVYLDFDLTNLAQTEDYYMVYLYYPKKDSLFDIQSMISPNNDNNMILISSKQFTNGRFHAHQHLNVSSKSFIGVTLTRISPEYYKFLSTYVIAAKPMNQITGEPINFPTNVVNGYGFFSTTNPEVDLFDLSLY